MTSNKSQYCVYKINKNGKASLDGHTNDRKSVYMLVDDLKTRNISGYVFDSVAKVVTEHF